MADADERLRRRCERDASRFADLYERHFARVYAFVLSRRSDRRDVSSVSEPADQPYGDRTAGVEDAFGKEWFIATQIQ
jgi:PhnB protein